MKMKTTCQVCMHHCQLVPGQYGACRTRKNENGRVICTNYGQATSLALDPIEKKPLHMFYPGNMILSVGSYGCNLRCPFCQNHEISMAGAKDIDFVYLSPEFLVQKAAEYKAEGNIGVAFTYNEPLIGWEYVYDTAKLIKKADMKTVLVTNGTATPQILDKLLPFVDAMNIDLKGFTQTYYQKLGGSLEAVKEFIQLAASGCHVELTTLIVPGENDSITQMEEEAGWIASVKTVNSSGQIPLHVTRFFPKYHMTDKNPTDVRQIHRLANAAGKYLKNVFVGNC